MLSFSTLLILHCLMASSVLEEKSQYSQSCFLCMMYIFFLWLLLTLLFIFVFQQFNYKMTQCIIFFIGCFVCLWVCYYISAAWVSLSFFLHGLKSFNFGKYSPMTSSNVCSAPFSLSYPSWAPITHVLDHPLDIVL